MVSYKERCHTEGLSDGVTVYVGKRFQCTGVKWAVRNFKENTVFFLCLFLGKADNLANNVVRASINSMYNCGYIKFWNCLLSYAQFTPT